MCTRAHLSQYSIREVSENWLKSVRIGVEFWTVGVRKFERDYARKCRTRLSLGPASSPISRATFVASEAEG